jgi:tetratricopeptide (TPR) repeat protein
MDFRTYAYLQIGDDKAAAQVVKDAATVTSPAESSLTFDTALAAIPARYALERGRWDDAAQIPVRESRHLPAQSISRFTRALGAARAGRREEARAELAELEAIEQRLIAAGDTYWSRQARIQIGAATAWIMLSENRPDEALAAMTEAAELDDASEKNIAMENKLLPMRELLGELYLALGRDSEAAGTFDASLTTAPNRFRTVAGAARAARAQNSIDDAKRHYGALIALARNADPNTPDIIEARTYLAQH